MPMGRIPRTPSSPGIRIGISPSTRLVLGSMMLMESFDAFETNTRPPAARIPEGLLPAWLFSPNGTPVRMKASTFAAAGVETSITATELDSRTLGSPRPGMAPVPRSASALGNPNAGNGSPVSRARLGSAPRIA